MVAERGVGILLVEHDMALVMNICDYVHVLDFGTKIFEGTTADVSSSDTVRAAYLGTEPVGRATKDGEVTAMLELRGIEAGYGEHTVLRDVSLTVQPGTVVAVLGPNGAGKTTLLRVASGLLRPSAGAVLLGGEDVTRARPYARARRGLCHIPEGRGIYPTLTVRENLVLHSRKGEEAAALDRATSAFPVLGEKLRHRPASCPAASSRCCRWSAPTSPIPSWSSWTRPRWDWPRSSSTRSSSSSARSPRPEPRCSSSSST